MKTLRLSFSKADNNSSHNGFRSGLFSIQSVRDGWKLQDTKNPDDISIEQLVATSVDLVVRLVLD